MSKVVEISDSEFSIRVLKSDLPVLVYFWAPWCGPCTTTTPLIDDISKNYSGDLIFYKVNVDKNPQSAGNYSVRSLPNILLFNKGVVQEQIVGSVKTSKILDSIKNLNNK